MRYLAFLRDNLRWLTAGFLLTAFSSFGQTFFISMSIGELREEMGLGHGDIGLIYMSATLCSGFMLSRFGRIVDTIALHRIALANMALLAALCLVMAYVQSVFLLCILLFGLRFTGQGMMSHIAFTAMGRWYSAERGRAISIASLGFPFAEALLPFVFVLVAEQIGWRNGWLLSGGAMLLMLPVIVFLLKRPHVPVNDAENKTDMHQRQWTGKETTRDPVFWALSAAVLAPPCFGTAIIFHQSYLLASRDWAAELFASSFTVMAVTAVMSSLLLGVLVDRFSAIKLLPFMLVPLCCATLVLASFHASWSAFVFMGLLGISNGFTATFSGALWPEIYGVKHIGAIRANAFALMVVSSAAGPGLMGVLLDFSVLYDFQLLGMAFYCLVVSAVLWLVAGTVKRRQADVSV